MGFFSDHLSEAIKQQDEDRIVELERENKRLKSEIEDYKKSTLFLRKQVVLLQNMLSKVLKVQVSDTRKDDSSNAADTKKHLDFITKEAQEMGLYD